MVTVIALSLIGGMAAFAPPPDQGVGYHPGDCIVFHSKMDQFGVRWNIFAHDPAGQTYQSEPFIDNDRTRLDPNYPDVALEFDGTHWLRPPNGGTCPCANQAVDLAIQVTQALRGDPAIAAALQAVTLPAHDAKTIAAGVQLQCETP
jgi:hypothetical protein